MRSHQASNRWVPIPVVFALMSWYTSRAVYASRLFSTPGGLFLRSCRPRFETVTLSRISFLRNSTSRKSEIFSNPDSSNHGSPERVCGNDRLYDNSKPDGFSNLVSAEIENFLESHVFDIRFLKKNSIPSNVVTSDIGAARLRTAFFVSLLCTKSAIFFYLLLF
jgi:hypothetical protein